MTDTKFFSSQKDGYWSTYLTARPDYTQSGFYERVLQYHRQHGSGTNDLAHDVACGPGQVAAELAQYFKHVVASDPNGAHVSVSQTRHAEQGRQNLSYATAAAEDIAQHAEGSSVDLITCAEAIALMDMPKCLEAFGEILKPGGTVALWFYGRPHFLLPDGEELDEGINKAYAALADHLFGMLIRNNHAMWQTPTSHMACWFNDLAVPETQWADVQRQKINADCAMSFFSPTAGDMDVKRPASVVGAHETCTSEVDRAFWGKEWAFEDALRFIKVNMPVFDPVKFEDEEYARLCGELKAAMGGEGAVRRVCWPVIVLLATKKG